jgi:flagellin-specific chaperone FliS
MAEVVSEERTQKKMKTIKVVDVDSRPSTNNQVFLLYDRKLNAIIGVFSTMNKLKEAKNHLIKTDLKLVTNVINSDLVLSDKINDELRTELAGSLYQIYHILNNKPDDLESSLVMYKGQSINTRYFTYVMTLDEYKTDSKKPFFSGGILLPRE